MFGWFKEKNPVQVGKWYMLKDPQLHRRPIYRLKKEDDQMVCVYEDGKALERGYSVGNMYGKPTKKVSGNQYRANTFTYESTEAHNLVLSFIGIMGGHYTRIPKIYDLIDDTALINKLDELEEKRKKELEDEKENFKSAILTATMAMS